MIADAKKRRRKIDLYLRGAREDPEAVLQEMTNLSNRLFRLFVGIVLTAGLVILVLSPFGPRTSWAEMAGVTLLLALANSLGWLLASKAQRKELDRPANFNQLVFLVALTVLISKLIFSPVLAWSPFLAPVPMLAMVLALMFGRPVSTILVLGVSFYVGLMSPRSGQPHHIDLVLALALAMGGMVSVLGMARVRQQSRPVVVGAWAGLIQAAVVLAFQLIAGKRAGQAYALADFGSRDDLRRFFQDPSWALVGGLISGAAVTCFLPALERFFGIVTERRLLALVDPNQKLLKALRNCAPGTYTHTLRVADLASAAAEAIGADPLLALVGAYYHDIGKIAKPEYFVENNEPGQNIHDKLRPSMSKLVIISHVKDGVELAEEAGLPQKITDMIPMHHGTTVVEYFFHKAKAEGDSSKAEVEYRYPGPKPAFREAGILMLADGVEAAAKTIAEPNPARFRTIVHELVLKKLLDHQLDESDLTMRDLARIEDSFLRTLTSMYHGRIKYPGTEGHAAPAPVAPAPAGAGPAGAGKADANHNDRQPAEVAAGGPAPAAGDPGGHPRGA